MKFVSEARRQPGFWGLILVGISLLGFVGMYVYSLYNNQNMITTMQNDLDPLSMSNVYANILGNRINGQRIALAKEFPAMSKFLGFQNSYTADMINNLVEQYGFQKEQVVLAIFYLETGLVVNNHDPWFSGGNSGGVPNHAPTLFNSLLYWILGDSPIIIAPTPSPPQTSFNFAKDALPYINTGVGFLGVLAMFAQMATSAAPAALAL